MLMALLLLLRLGIGEEGGEVAVSVVAAEEAEEEEEDEARVGVEADAAELLHRMEGLYGCAIGGPKLKGTAKNALAVLNRSMVPRPPNPAARRVASAPRVRRQWWCDELGGLASAVAAAAAAVSGDGCSAMVGEGDEGGV